jgi:chromosome segregation ATPase
VLYLAEVQQKKGGLIGASKKELKLIACQRSEQSWSPCDETITAPDTLAQNAGALVMVELNANKQIRGNPVDAGRQLVSILQNFSRLQDKSKAQEDEIEQWKQSLTYQSQELNRREMEMEARQEQLQQLEEDLQRLDQERQEIETAKAEAERLREEFDRKSQELEGAWAHLNGELRRFEERQAELSGAASLDEEQAEKIQGLLNRLSSAVAPTESVREKIHSSFEAVEQQQGVFNEQWQTLEQLRGSVGQIQSDLETQAQQVEVRKQEWQQALSLLEQTRASMQSQQQLIEQKQAHLQSLTAQLDNQIGLHHSVCQLADGSDTFTIGAKVDLAVLEAMPLDELLRTVQELQQELEKNSKFVSSQEEELKFKQQDIDELKARIQAASDFDRLQLENELKDEQDGYNMLNETLVGQRRNLRERQAILKQHQRIAAQRQGLPLGDASDAEVDLEPVLSKIEVFRQKLADDIKELEGQIQHLQSDVATIQGRIEQHQAEQQIKYDALQHAEEQWRSHHFLFAEASAKVEIYPSLLQPAQDTLNILREHMSAIADMMAQFQEASDYQLQATAEMQQMINQLTNQISPELAASS